MKIQYDKYYTDKEIVDKCWDIITDTIDMNKVTEIVESSAGDGAWLEKIKATGIPYVAYDIIPEHPEIIQKDFLELEMEYKKGRALGFNPPYGRSNNLSRQFFKKAVGICDYIIFIQPISQLENNITMYEFDLIKSVDLGKAIYSGKKIHCCLNIYKRPDASIRAWEELYGE